MFHSLVSFEEYCFMQWLLNLVAHQYSQWSFPKWLPCFALFIKSLDEATSLNIFWCYHPWKFWLNISFLADRCYLNVIEITHCLAYTSEPSSFRCSFQIQGKLFPRNSFDFVLIFFLVTVYIKTLFKIDLTTKSILKKWFPVFLSC